MPVSLTFATEASLISAKQCDYFIFRTKTVILMMIKFEQKKVVAMTNGNATLWWSVS